MAIIEVKDRTVEVDEEGYLLNTEDWTPDVAEVFALNDDCSLTDEHWDIIEFLRKYYKKYKIVPEVRMLTKLLGKELGQDKGNAKYLYELFPYGLSKQASRYAGLPKPPGEV